MKKFSHWLREGDLFSIKNVKWKFREENSFKVLQYVRDLFVHYNKFFIYLCISLQLQDHKCPSLYKHFFMLPTFYILHVARNV